MAVTTRGIDLAEYTFCYEVRQRPGEDQEIVRLPWAFLRFGDAGEERKYVVPIPPHGVGGSGVSNVFRPAREFAEFMGNRPFPHESGRPQQQNAVSDANKAGPWSVHFFGPV